MTEGILSAALCCREVIFSMPRPNRHHHILQAAFPAGETPPPYPLYQGFLTTTGRFVDRFDAMVIAREAGDFKDGDPKRPELFSEDLW
jgi:hypothetical protein